MSGILLYNDKDAVERKGYQNRKQNKLAIVKKRSADNSSIILAVFNFAEHETKFV
jgi:hypothetical protein